MIERNRIYQGTALEVLKTFPDESIDMCMTSPPYWGLRAYGTNPQIWDGNPECEHDFETIRVARPNASGGKGHMQDGNIGSFTSDYKDRATYSNTCTKCGAWKGELGLEPTFQLYIEHLCQIFDEVKRVLKPEGSCWVNLGDSYAGAQGRGQGKGNEHSQMQPKGKDSILKDKCLCQIPSRFAIAMTDRGWILRNELIWFKPNCMPSSVSDRFTVDFEKLFFFTKQTKYYFEQQFEPALTNESRPDGVVRNRVMPPIGGIKKAGGDNPTYSGNTPEYNPLGRNKRCVWTINTQPLKETHFAAYPEKLCETPILAGCPEFICKVCGKAREKVYKVVGTTITEAMRASGCNENGEYNGAEVKDYDGTLAQNPGETKNRILKSMSEIKQVEYTDCGCFKEKPDTKGDTTGMVDSAGGRKHYWSVQREHEVDQKKVAAFIKEKINSENSKILDENFGNTTWSHWIRTDDSGASMPSPEQYKKLKEILALSDEFDKEMLTTVNVFVDDSGSKKVFAGYKDCGHENQYMPGIVLDPFMGSGTTGLTAKKLKRDYVGIEMNPEYIEIADRRIGKPVQVGLL